MRPQLHLKDVIRNLPVDEGRIVATSIITAIVAKGLEAKSAKEKEERIAKRGSADKHNPSVTDAGKCPRQVDYSLRNVPESNPPDLHSRMNFLMGSLFEEGMARLMEEIGAKVVRESRVEIPAGNTVVSGRRDFLLEFPEPITVDVMGKEYVVADAIFETKNTSSRSMSWTVKHGPPDSYISQLNLYLHATQQGLLGEKAYDEGYLVYGITNNVKGEPSLQAWRVQYDEMRALRDLHSLAAADDRAKHGSQPPRPDGYTLMKFPCSYCSYKTTCWNEPTDNAIAAALEESILIAAGAQ